MKKIKNRILNNKEKIFGISLISFIILIVWLWIKPEEKIDKILFTIQNIDSLAIIDNSKTYVIKEKEKLNLFLEQFQSIQSINVEDIRSNTDLIRINIYFKYEGRLDVSLLDNTMAGYVFTIKSQNYSNDSLAKLIKGEINFLN